MKGLLRLAAFLLLWIEMPAVHGAFTSLYIFGDGTCTTTTGPGGPYYGNRFSNGRVWVEVLAQRQAIPYDPDQNRSFYGHYSTNMVVTVSNLPPPVDASSALFIIWACNADFVQNVQFHGSDLVAWTNSINASLANHFKIITNLYYGKNARTLLMPNAVDLTKVPFYQNYNPANKAFVRQRTIEFNIRFNALLNDAMQSLPGLTIHSPDIFALLDSMTATPANYGLIKPETCVIFDLPPAQWTLNGPGTNYVFWDDLHPTAMAHMVIADTIQQLMSPVAIRNIAQDGGGVRLEVMNVPVGRNGSIDSSPDFLDWSGAHAIDSTNATLTFILPASDPRQFFRLRFPFSWTWP